MTEEQRERRHDYIDIVDRIARVETKVEANAKAVILLDDKLVAHAHREEEAAIHREARLSEKLDKMSSEIRQLHDSQIERKSKNALLAMLGAGLVAIATIVIQMVTGFRH